MLGVRPAKRDDLKEEMISGHFAAPNADQFAFQHAAVHGTASAYQAILDIEFKEMYPNE